MKVIWKRPDGFHGASPSDYVVVQVATNVKIWLHKHDDQNFPFRVSGGWQDEDATRRLNRLVNLLNKNDEQWIKQLVGSFFDSHAESGEKFIADLESWLSQLQQNLKGDHWETTIMHEVFTEVEHKLKQLRAAFLAKANNTPK